MQSSVDSSPEIATIEAEIKLKQDQLQNQGFDTAEIQQTREALQNISNQVQEVEQVSDAIRAQLNDNN